jgi:MazG family protein
LSVKWELCSYHEAPVFAQIFYTDMPNSKRPSKRRYPKTSKQNKIAISHAHAAGEWFERLVALQARLRGPRGCPWDREQTHASLRTYLIEEVYEVLDALESGTDAKFAEELGDLLLQVVFHAQIASEEGRFAITDVIREIHEKLVRRHPHVFGKKRARNAAEVLKNWEQIKAEERKSIAALANPSETEYRESLLDGLPNTLPAVMQALQLTRRVARIGFDWDSVEGVFEKLKEETIELREALRSNSPENVESEMGDLLFAAVNLARFLKVDPEIALKKANAKFSARFREMENSARESGRQLADVPRPEMEALWNRAKESRVRAQRT